MSANSSFLMIVRLPLQVEQIRARQIILRVPEALR